MQLFALHRGFPEDSFKCDWQILFFMPQVTSVWSPAACGTAELGWSLPLRNFLSWAGVDHEACRHLLLWCLGAPAMGQSNKVGSCGTHFSSILQCRAGLLQATGRHCQSATPGTRLAVQSTTDSPEAMIRCTDFPTPPSVWSGTRPRHFPLLGRTVARQVSIPGLPDKWTHPGKNLRKALPVSHSSRAPGLPWLVASSFQSASVSLLWLSPCFSLPSLFIYLFKVLSLNSGPSP
jgi:hypothetical protein